MDYAYYNGHIDTLTDTKIPLTDRAIFFGDGVYDCMIGLNGKIYQKKEHTDRLFRCAKALSIDVNITESEVSNILETLVRKSNYDSFLLYIQISRYSPTRVHYSDKSRGSNILATITKYTPPAASGGISLISLTDVRYKLCDVKTLNLLPSVLAAKEAFENKCDEAVFLRDGIVTECSHSNIFIIKSGVLITHPLTQYILPGITRQNLINAAREIDIPTEERYFGYRELISADEILVTSTTALARRVASLDGNPIKCASPELAGKLMRLLEYDLHKNCC